MTNTHYDESQLESSRQFFTFKDLIRTIWRGRWIVGAAIVIPVILAIAYAVTSTSIYTATARILIDPRQIDPLSTSADGRGYSDLLVIDSQIEILRSRELARRAMQSMDLFEATAPEINTSLFAVVRNWISGLATSETDQAEAEATTQRAMVENFAGKISVARVRLTYAIAISFTHKNPKFAAQSANAVANAYLEDQLQSQFESANRSRTWVSDQLSDMRSRLLDAESAVEEYRAKNNLASSIGNRAPLGDEQLSELNTQLILARAETAEAKARKERLNAIIASNDPNYAVADVLSSQIINRLRQQSTDASQRAAEIKQKYGQDHEVYQNAIGDLNRINREIRGEVERIAQSYSNEYEIAIAREEALAEQISNQETRNSSTGQASIRLRELERQASAARATYQSLLDSSNQLAQRETLPITEARVIEKAEPPRRPSAPNRRLIVIAAGLFGAIAGLALVVLRQSIDNRIWNQEMLEQASGHQSLGVVPQLPLPSTPATTQVFGASTPGLKRLASEMRGPRLINSLLLQPYVRALSDPFSQQVEVLRAVNLNLMAARQQSATAPDVNPGAQVISFISSAASEGKTTLSLLYAIYLAQNGVSVAMIDCDYRRPNLTRTLAPDAHAGIFELPFAAPQHQIAPLVDAQSAARPALTADDVKYTAFEGMLTMLPGRINDRPQPLIEERMPLMLDHLIKEYRHSTRVILVDLPPVLTLPDTPAVAGQLDSLFLIAKWGQTERSTIQSVFTHSSHLHQKVAGCILNSVKLEELNLYGATESARIGYYA